MKEQLRIADSLRASVAGGHAAALAASSLRLFEAGGKELLSDEGKRVLRKIAERSATGAIALATGPVLGASAIVGKPLASAIAAESATALSASAARSSAAALGASGARQVATSAGKQAMRAAGAQIMKGAGKAAGIGFAIDGAIASFEAIVAVRNGSTDTKSAAIYVAKEATTGAVATGVGVLLGASLVALTGGIAAPVVFAVGAIGSVGTKRLLQRLVR